MFRGIVAALIGMTLTLVGPVAAQAAAPANDNFSAATPLAVGAEISASNVDATAQAGEPDPNTTSHSAGCANPADAPRCSSSVWFSFTPASSGEYTIETCDQGTEINSTLGVYTGLLGALVAVKENDDGEPYDCPAANSFYGSRVTFAAAAGTEYHVYVGGQSGDEGSFWVRAYAGPTQLRPQPDTALLRESSAALRLRALVGPGVKSGPRHSPSLAIATTPPGAAVECSLDGVPFGPCAAAISLDNLGSGAHVIQVRARLGGAVDPTPLVHRFIVDRNPPQTSLSGPSGPLASQTAAWAIGNTETTKFFSDVVCGVDLMPVTGCGRTTTVENLCQGPHTFTASAVDLAMNPDPTPATARIDVTTGPPCEAPTVGDPGPVGTAWTEAAFQMSYDSKGAGGRLEVLYGTTAAYGETTGGRRVDPTTKTVEAKATLSFLKPSTTYHFKVVLETPFGIASSADRTFTTDPAPGPMFDISNGPPEVVGSYAAVLPFTVDTHGNAYFHNLLLEEGKPVDGGSRRLQDVDGTPAGLGIVTERVPIEDLEPATTYHYRFAARGAGGAGDVLGPEGTFTTPPYATPIPLNRPRSRFKLRRKQIRVAKLRRHSKRLLVTVRGVPARTKVTVKLRAGKSKQTARKRAKANGRASFRISLAKRIRKALLDPKLKRVTIKITAKPPGEAASSITLRQRIRG